MLAHRYGTKRHGRIIRYGSAGRTVSHLARALTSAKLALNTRGFHVSTNENTRREFLGKLGSALSGLVLAGGAGGISRGQSVLPNGYNFYRIFDANDNKTYYPYYQPNPVAEVSAAVMITGGTGSPLFNKLIYFHGTTTAAFN